MLEKIPENTNSDHQPSTTILTLKNFSKCFLNFFMDADSTTSLANIVSAEAPSGEERGFARKWGKKKKSGDFDCCF